MSPSGGSLHGHGQGHHEVVPATHDSGQRLWPVVLAGGMLGSGMRWSAVAAVGWSGVVVVDAINVLGAFLLGAAAARLVDARSRAFWLTGVLGSLTTWSTFMVDAVLLAQRGDLAWAMVHVVASCGLGVVAARAGRRLVAAGGLQS